MKSSAISASSLSRPHSEVFLSTREESAENTPYEIKLQNPEKSGEKIAHTAAVGKQQEQQTIFVGSLTNKPRDQISGAGATRHAEDTTVRDDTEPNNTKGEEEQPKQNKLVSSGSEGFSACAITTKLGTTTVTTQSTCTSASSPLSSSSVPMPFPFHALSSPCPSSLQQDFQEVNEREREIGVGAIVPTAGTSSSKGGGGGQDSSGQCRCTICRGDGYVSKLEIVSFAGTSGRLFALSKRRGISPSLPKEKDNDYNRDERRKDNTNSIHAHNDTSRLGGSARHTEGLGSCGSVLEWVHNRHAFLPSSHEALRSAKAEHDRLTNRKKSKSSKVSENINRTDNNSNTNSDNATTVSNATSTTLSPPCTPSSLTSPASSSSPRSAERRYHGIFGVYTLGQVSFLVLIKSVAAVATGVPQYGSIFRITGLELMELPRHRSASQQGQQRGGESKRNNQTGFSSPSFAGAASSPSPPTARCQLGKESLERYRRILERFCNVSDFAGGSALYTSYESSMTMRLGPLRQHEPSPTGYTSHTTDESNRWATRIERQTSNTTDGDGDREGPMHRAGTFIDSEAYQEALADEIYRRAYSFQWNEPGLWLNAFDACPTWLVPPIIRGYVGRDVVYIPPQPSPTTAVSSSAPLASSSSGDRAHSSAPLPASVNSAASGIAGSFIDVALITRLSPRRAGTRYCRRGIDKPPQGSPQGFVANFSETEQIVWSVKTLLASSYVTVRGSAPVLWSQRADLRIVPRITIEGEMDLYASSVDDQGRSSVKKKGMGDGGGGCGVGVGGNNSSGGYDYPNEWGENEGGGEGVGGGGSVSDTMLEIETFEGHLSVMAHMRYLSSLYADRLLIPSDTTTMSGSSSDEDGRMDEGEGDGGEACVHGFKKAGLRCKICSNETARWKKGDLSSESSPVSVGDVPSFAPKSRPLRFIFLNLLGRQEQEGRLSSHLRIAIRKHNSESKKVALSLRVSPCHLDLNRELKAALPSLFNSKKNAEGALRQQSSPHFNSLGAVCAEYDSAFYRATESIQTALGPLVPDWGNIKANCWPLLPPSPRPPSSLIGAASEVAADETTPHVSRENGAASHPPLLQGLARMKLGPSTSRQDVLFRINCLDCLDRSNIAQCCISMQALRSQIRSIIVAGGERREGSSHHPSDLGFACEKSRVAEGKELDGNMTDNFSSYCASELAALAVSWSARKLWVALGDELALLYTGTRAHGASVLLPLPQSQPQEVSLCGSTICYLRKQCDSPSRTDANRSGEQTKEPSEGQRQRQGQQGLIDAIQKVTASRLAFFYGVTQWIPPVVAGVQTAMKRWINNNFYDAQKQDVVSLVVGDHIPYNQKAELPTFGPNAVFTINIVAVLALYALCVVAMAINTILFLFDALPTHTWAAVESGWIGVLLTLLILTLTRGSGVIVTLPTLYENRVGGVELDRSG